jgi:hypothetical protein
MRTLLSIKRFLILTIIRVVTFFHTKRKVVPKKRSVDVRIEEAKGILARMQDEKRMEEIKKRISDRKTGKKRR